MAILKNRISEIAARRVKKGLNFKPLWYKESINMCNFVQLAQLWPMAKFHAQIFQFWKSAHISKAAASRAKIGSIPIPWGREWVYVELLPKCGNFENRSVSQWTHVLYWCVWSFSVPGHFNVIWCTCLKMACNSKTAVCRKKRSEIWKSGVAVNMYMEYLWPVIAQGNLGGFHRAVKQRNINKLAPYKTRYFTSSTCLLIMTLNWMSGQMV